MNFSKTKIFSKIYGVNIYKKKLEKIPWYRNDLSNDNSSFWKTFYKNNDNTNRQNYYKSNNINKSVVVESNNIQKIIRKIRRPVGSATLPQNNSNINAMQKIMKIIEKKLLPLTSLRNAKPDKNKHNLSLNNSIVLNNSYLNSYFNSNYSKRINKLKTGNKFKIHSGLNRYQKMEIDNMENTRRNRVKSIKHKNGIKKYKTDLIPYPYKRLQLKIRKYFSLSKNILLLDKQGPFSFLLNQYKPQSSNIMENKLIENNINKNVNNNKLCKNNNIIKLDKSINTENNFFGRNCVNLNNNKINNNNGKVNKIKEHNYEGKNKNKANPIFNNKIIASIANHKDLNIFITTSNEKNNKEKEKRTINVYHKNY